ncbi:hypothetical protein [Nitrosopumilus sp.]|uniref:hypothetical protein n=1 Tax=Nitrosopumilus sp. TaxID=2024843 RepID=UPI00247BD9E8|nr:hypothetical protein [Nitrosopumilus sp.]MCV0409298.1 hypothetical protein [Nitrosopumilus sp.]
MMNRIGLIEGYDETKVRDTLNLMLRDRQNEFRELAESLGIPRTAEDWFINKLKITNMDFHL